jgi:hypothetical protein
LSRLSLVVLLAAMLVLAACSGGDGLPKAAGRYAIKEKSVSFDGERYQFFWADAGGNLHRAASDDVKLKLGDATLLEITDKKEAILHLKQEEPVTVEGRDRNGDFNSFWYPFLIGSMLSRGGGPVIVNQPAPQEYRDPKHRFPPTDSFDRGDTIGGNVTSNTNRPPDYSRVPPVAGTLSGQAGGTGGANAVTGRAQSASVSSGQSGGTGSGSAAINKAGTFKRGDQGFDAKVDRGQIKSVTGNNAPRVGAGASSSGSAPRVSTGRSSTGAPRISTGRRR